MEKFFRGEISEAELDRRVKDWMTDVERFEEIWYHYGNGANLLVDSGGVKRNFGNSVRNLILGFRKLDSEFQSLLRQFRSDEVMLTKLKKQRSHAYAQLRSGEWIEELNKVFGRGAGEIVSHYAERLVAGARAPQDNDFGDLMHLLYATHVDIIRCDLSMSAIFRDYFGNQPRVVARLEDLLATLDELLA